MNTDSSGRLEMTAEKTVEKTVEFEAVIEAAHGGGHAIAVPFDAKQTFGAARARVHVVVDGQLDLRTTLASYGARNWIGLRKAQLAELGAAVGDQVSVRVAPDLEPRVVVPPDDLVEALSADSDAQAAFERLACSHQREYVNWIGEAKRADTRQRRIVQTLERLRDGRTR